MTLNWDWRLIVCSVTTVVWLEDLPIRPLLFLVIQLGMLVTALQTLQFMLSDILKSANYNIIVVSHNFSTKWLLSMMF